MKLFASRLRERAAELGISQAEVARRSGLTEQRFYNYVAGVREPDLATLVRIAGTLQTTPDQLLGIGGERPQSPRTILIGRLNSAAQALSDYDLEMAVILTEALGDRECRLSPPPK